MTFHATPNSSEKLRQPLDRFFDVVAQLLAKRWLNDQQANSATAPEQGADQGRESPQNKSPSKRKPKCGPASAHAK